MPENQTWYSLFVGQQTYSTPLNVPRPQLRSMPKLSQCIPSLVQASLACTSQWLKPLHTFSSCLWSNLQCWGTSRASLWKLSTATQHSSSTRHQFCLNNTALIQYMLSVLCQQHSAHLLCCQFCVNNTALIQQMLSFFVSNAALNQDRLPVVFFYNTALGQYSGSVSFNSSQLGLGISLLNNTALNQNMLSVFVNNNALGQYSDQFLLTIFSEDLVSVFVNNTALSQYTPSALSTMKHSASTAMISLCQQHSTRLVVVLSSSLCQQHSAWLAHVISLYHQHSASAHSQLCQQCSTWLVLPSVFVNNTALGQHQYSASVFVNNTTLGQHVISLYQQHSTRLVHTISCVNNIALRQQQYCHQSLSTTQHLTSSSSIQHQSLSTTQHSASTHHQLCQQSNTQLVLPSVSVNNTALSQQKYSASVFVNNTALGQHMSSVFINIRRANTRTTHITKKCVSYVS